MFGISLGITLPIHRSLRVTPAMEAAITDHAWTLAELIAA